MHANTDFIQAFLVPDEDGYEKSENIGIEVELNYCKEGR